MAVDAGLFIWLIYRLLYLAVCAFLLAVSFGRSFCEARQVDEAFTSGLCLRQAGTASGKDAGWAVRQADRSLCLRKV
jgi:hypothetical protein